MTRQGGGVTGQTRQDIEAERLAQHFHEAYERLAPSFAYETRKSSAVAWADVPENNRRLMVAVAAELLASGEIEADEAMTYKGQRDAVLDRLRAAKALHFSRREWREEGNLDLWRDVCAEDGQPYPCRSIRVAEGEGEKA